MLSWFVAAARWLTFAEGKISPVIKLFSLPPWSQPWRYSSPRGVIHYQYVKQELSNLRNFYLKHMNWLLINITLNTLVTHSSLQQEAVQWSFIIVISRGRVAWYIKHRRISGIGVIKNYVKSDLALPTKASKGSWLGNDEKLIITVVFCFKIHSPNRQDVMTRIHVFQIIHYPH